MGMDTFALGLIKAAEIIEDGIIDGFIKEKYSSYESGIGKKIRDKQTTLGKSLLIQVLDVRNILKEL